MNTLSAWFTGYTQHPFGKNATYSDYAMSAVLALLIIFLLYKLAEHLT